MATLTTNLGPNSAVVAFAQSTAVTDIMDAIEAVIVAHGWTIHDSSAGANARCYKSQNADGSTFKYVVLDFNTALTLIIKVYETWDSALHTGTNLCGLHSDVEFTQQVNTNDKGLIYIYVSSRWMAFIVKAYSTAVLGSANHTGVTGCFEIARDNPEDTVAMGYPCFCFLNTGVLGDGYSLSKPSLLLPRTHAGNTGTSQYGDVSTIFGKTSLTLKTYNFCPTTTNPWNGLDWAISMYAHGPSNEVKGRLFGLKLFTRDALFFMDKLKVPCDGSLHYDAAGTLTDHFIVPGGNVENSVYSSRFLVPA